METSIALSACGAFGNAGGELNCDTPANADGIPEGSYLGSCGGCSLAKLPTTGLPGNVLTCTHYKMGDGQHHESNIDTSECHQVKCSRHHCHGVITPSLPCDNRAVLAPNIWSHRIACAEWDRRGSVRVCGNVACWTTLCCYVHQNHE